MFRRLWHIVSCVAVAVAVAVVVVVVGGGGNGGGLVVVVVVVGASFGTRSGWGHLRCFCQRFNIPATGPGIARPCQ